MKRYKIFKLIADHDVYTLSRFDHWADIFDTEIECETKIREFGKPFFRYIILPIYDI